LVVTNSTFVGNSAWNGGTIWNNPNASATVTNSTFSENSATYAGGAIENMGGSLSVSFSTFSGNAAPQGGAIFTSTNFLDTRTLRGCRLRHPIPNPGITRRRCRSDSDAATPLGLRFGASSGDYGEHSEAALIGRAHQR